MHVDLRAEMMRSHPELTGRFEGEALQAVRSGEAAHFGVAVVQGGHLTVETRRDPNWWKGEPAGWAGFWVRMAGVLEAARGPLEWPGLGTFRGRASRPVERAGAWLLTAPEVTATLEQALSDSGAGPWSALPHAQTSFTDGVLTAASVPERPRTDPDALARALRHEASRTLRALSIRCVVTEDLLEGAQLEGCETIDWRGAIGPAGIAQLEAIAPNLVALNVQGAVTRTSERFEVRAYHRPIVIHADRFDVPAGTLGKLVDTAPWQTVTEIRVERPDSDDAAVLLEHPPPTLASLDLRQGRIPEALQDALKQRFPFAELAGNPMSPWTRVARGKTFAKAWPEGGIGSDRLDLIAHDFKRCTVPDVFALCEEILGEVGERVEALYPGEPLPRARRTSVRSLNRLGTWARRRRKAATELTAFGVFDTLSTIAVELRDGFLGDYGNDFGMGLVSLIELACWIEALEPTNTAADGLAWSKEREQELLERARQLPGT
jgi:hypothetical protein